MSERDGVNPEWRGCDPADADDVGCDHQRCTLREAIIAANAQAGPDVIEFAIPGADPGCDGAGVCTIQPARLLPILTDDGTTIDGFTQPGAGAMPSPVLLAAGGDRVGGTACAGCTVEVFSDVDDEGARFECSTTADDTGAWLFVRAGGLGGPHVTATATDAAGNTSAFSAPVAIGCAGDCDGNQAVAIDELIRGVNIALGELSLDACPALDGDGDRRVGVNELIGAVNNALLGCARRATSAWWGGNSRGER